MSPNRINKNISIYISSPEHSFRRTHGEFFLFFSCIWSALPQFLCSVSNSSVCATFFKFFTCSCLQSYICRDFVLWEKHENKHNFPLLSWLGGFLQDAVWTQHSLRSFSNLSSYFHHDHHHQLDKPARLTIRVLWFLFLIAFVKSEVRKQIGRQWHCLAYSSFASLFPLCSFSAFQVKRRERGVKHSRVRVTIRSPHGSTT